MILTVVPNPALDKTVVIPGFNVGYTYRPAEVVTLAGCETIPNGAKRLLGTPDIHLPFEGANRRLVLASVQFAPILEWSPISTM